jgi:hypothetical protein
MNMLICFYECPFKSGNILRKSLNEGRTNGAAQAQRRDSRMPIVFGLRNRLI